MRTKVLKVNIKQMITTTCRRSSTSKHSLYMYRSGCLETTSPSQVAWESSQDRDVIEAVCHSTARWQLDGLKEGCSCGRAGSPQGPEQSTMRKGPLLIYAADWSAPTSFSLQCRWWHWAIEWPIIILFKEQQTLSMGLQHTELPCRLTGFPFVEKML